MRMEKAKISNKFEILDPVASTISAKFSLALMALIIDQRVFRFLKMILKYPLPPLPGNHLLRLPKFRKHCGKQLPIDNIFGKCCERIEQVLHEPLEGPVEILRGSILALTSHGFQGNTGLGYPNPPQEG